MAPYVLIGNSCLQTSCLTAPVPSFPNNGVCTPCDANCLTCQKLATQCVTCRAGYSLDVTTAKCSNLCTIGQYLDSTSKRCTPCNPNCKECVGPNEADCVTCTDSTSDNQIYKLASGAKTGCYSDCPINYYGDDASSTCKSCFSKCTLCKGPL
jgi:hypothetical protein